MKKYLPIQEAFKRYDSLDAIENHYPDIFTEGHFHRHVREENGQWLVEDKSALSERDNTQARLTRDEMLAIAHTVGAK